MALFINVLPSWSIRYFSECHSPHSKQNFNSIIRHDTGFNYTVRKFRWPLQVASQTSMHFQMLNRSVRNYTPLITVRNEVAKVMFLHLSVILSTGGGLPQCMLGTHTPPPRCRPPGPDTSWNQTPPGTRHPPDQTYPPPRETAAAADGTHPTGMHSC